MCLLHIKHRTLLLLSFSEIANQASVFVRPPAVCRRPFRPLLAEYLGYFPCRLAAILLRDGAVSVTSLLVHDFQGGQASQPTERYVKSLSASYGQFEEPSTICVSWGLGGGGLGGLSGFSIPLRLRS